MLNLLRSLRSWLLIGWILFLVPLLARAQQDIQVIGGTNPYITIGRGLAWAGSGPGNLNNNFIFHPIDPNEGFCLFIGNNNPSNSHTVTVAVSQSGDPTLNQFIGLSGQWFTVPTITTFPVTVPAATVVGVNYKTTASATVAVQFSGATLQAGSPDTVNIFAVQTNQSACGSLGVNSVQGVAQNGTTQTNANTFPVQIGGVSSPGATGTVRSFFVGGNNGFVLDGTVCCQAGTQSFFSTPASSFDNIKGTSGSGVQSEAVFDVMPLMTFGQKGWIGGGMKTNFLELATDQFQNGAGTMPAWVTMGKLTNPTAASTLLSDFLGTTGVVNPAYRWLTLSCSAICEIQVARATARGTTCTGLTPQNLQIGNNGVQQAYATGHTVENNCTGAPTLSTVLYDLNLPAGGATTLDLAGVVDFHSATSGSGLNVSVITGFTGIATASLTLAEQ